MTLKYCLAALFASCLSAQASTLEVHVSTPAGKSVEDAAVVLEPVAGIPPPREARASIAQQDRDFVPYVTIVRTGTAIDFPNRDPLKHHVYSFSSAKRFEIKLYAGKPAQPVIFDKPGEVALGCNIHDWMEAYVLVVNTPYFAKTSLQGRALLADVPPGRYRLRFWHPRQKAEPPAHEIEIGGRPAKLEQVMDVAARVFKPRQPTDAELY
ncbi:MAG: methylamine utilization protein [Proteobacteria bacterium]|nr:methylamine utilization protein [Pseudomonadota bacterium]